MSYRIRRREINHHHQLPDSLSPLLQRIYAARGVERAQQLQLTASALIPPAQLDGTEQAIDRLIAAREQQQTVVICGDFDADGATSTALMLSALAAMGFQHLNYCIPNRFSDGYGLTPGLVKQAQAQGAELIITVDSGIACFAGVDHAMELGIDVIITDHHLPAERLPAATSIVNPNLPNARFPSKALAGVGVCFYLLLALRAALRERFDEAGPNLAEWLDLVAVGTVADVVALDHNNRILVHQGLQRIRAGKARPGIAALIEVSGRNPATLQAPDLGFAVGPRINAAGRLDDMALGVECLLATNRQQALENATMLDQLNRQRRDIEATMRDEADAIVDNLQLAGELPKILTLFHPQWHSGVVGIVAGRIKERHQRPVIVFAQENGQSGLLKGSARSIAGFHIRDFLERLQSRYPDVITRFGGHAMAAGLSVDEAQWPAFQQAVQQVIEEWPGLDVGETVYWSDGELDPSQLHLATAEQLAHAGPWGQGFPEPLFDGQFTLVQQRIVASKHLKLVVKQGTALLDAIAFNVDLSVWPNASVRRVELVYRLQVNEYRGKKQLQLLVEQLRPLR